MKCPKTYHCETNSKGNEVWLFADCLKEECAWWIPKMAQCCVWQIAAELSLIADTQLDRK